MSKASVAYGYGISTIAKDGSILDTYFHQLGLGTAEASRVDLANLEGADNEREITRALVKTEIELDKPPASVSDAYLRLHLLSHRLVKPHGLSLEGIFSILNNVIWTSHGPCAIAGFDQVRLKLRAKYGYLAIYGVDKFPRMLDYVVPEGVRIADADRVRLGAYLSPGTTVMHEGFVNFNAGTLGASMVEGRISAGVVVDDGSDIGGGASIMGTLSGGGKEVISIGKRTLLGANSGLGISLGDDCVLEAGVYLTAGSKVLLPDGKVVKARELSGANSLLIRRNSQSGALEALNKSGTWGGLNSVLHTN
ncbi:MAG: 2,3,4,5-tetrahydropyridine-2,6-dicarboxylate N-succinyltransferase [Candidatus Nanopelagicaceae bacterium]